MLTLGSGSWLYTKERKGTNSWASPQMAEPFLNEYELAYQLTLSPLTLSPQSPSIALKWFPEPWTVR